MALALDVDRPESVADGVERAVGRFGTIDGLINNAGFGMVGSVEDTSQSDWHAVMRTNFFGAIAVVQAVLPIMRAQRSGTIVNVSSSGGQVAFAGLGGYCASKFALEGMSEALAEEMASFGVNRALFGQASQDRR